MRKILSSFILACFVLSGTPVLADGLAAKDKRPEVADFELSDVKGKDVKLSSYKGKVVAVSFWASWCEPCKQELSFLHKYKKANPDKDFEIVAVATDAPETISKVKSIVKRKKWKFAVPLDTEGKVSAILNPRGATPFAMFIDKNGKLAYSHEGFKSGDEEKYKPLINTLLSE